MNIKITVIAVSAPVLSGLVQFREKLNRIMDAPNMEWSFFSVASATVLEGNRASQYLQALSDADLAIVDIMGASAALTDLVEKGLKNCRGQRIVIGNGCREYNRLGSFSMEKMQMGRKKSQSEMVDLRKETVSGHRADNFGEKSVKNTEEIVDLNQETVSEYRFGNLAKKGIKSRDGMADLNNKETASVRQSGNKGKKSAKNASAMMHTMRRMALMMGSMVPFGMMKDMKNLFRIIDYWQAATPEDIESMMCLILRGYFGVKQLPKEKPCTLRYGIYLDNPLNGRIVDGLDSYWKAQGYNRNRDTVALLFYGHRYPNDFRPVVRALYERLADTYNILPIAFSQNEDKDLKRLEGYVCSKKYPVSLMINLMPFRLGAGPMGGDASYAVQILKKADVPYLKPLCLTKTDREAWAYEQAIPPGEFLISVMLPELDGGIYTYPVGILEQDPFHERKKTEGITGTRHEKMGNLHRNQKNERHGNIYKGQTNFECEGRMNCHGGLQYEEQEINHELRKSESEISGKYDFDGLTRIAPIPERIDSLCKRAARFLALQKKENAKKRIALICYNYPPGEGSLFGGAFLDTFASVSEILKGLKADGYRVDEMGAEDLKSVFLQDGMCNEPQWSGEAASEFSYVVDGVSYPVRGIVNGNVFIGLQPMRVDRAEQEVCQEFLHNQSQAADSVNAEWETSQELMQNQLRTENSVNAKQETSQELIQNRSRTADGAKAEREAYHDRNLKPSGRYRAFYRWLRESFGADALVHVGTHGTLEFLPGKENGVTGDCWPDRMVGDIPHFYFYYMGNPAEAMIAKRRSHAVLVSYQPPFFQESGLYGQYGELKRLIAEYRESVQSAPEKCTDLLQEIGTLAKTLRLIRENRDLEEQIRPLQENDLDDIDEKLYDIETALIPHGLHVIGRGYTVDEAKAYAERVVNYAYTDVSKEERERHMERLARMASSNQEIDGLLHALRGEYLPVGCGGDIFKNPDMLPAGRNLVQFDPRQTPTRTACRRGADAARGMLEKYYEKHGSYPVSTAVILWGLETSKSQGETLGQILYYLGVRLKKEDVSFSGRFEVIPSEELGRPRVDVLIHICGFFRDMYPNLIEDLNDIFARLDRLDEPDEMSGFAKMTRVRRAELLAQGYGEQEASKFSQCRIFGPAEGEYGTNIRTLVHKGQWDEAAELGTAFTDDLSFLYTSSRRAVSAKQMLRRCYADVEMISQVQNNVEYELVDLDHYYEFFGGLARAVENVKGEGVELFVANTTGMDVRTFGFRESVERGIRTRLVNPRWIEGMMRHGYHGVQQVNRRFENMLGLAASTGQVDGCVFSDLERCYVHDGELAERMRESNRWAYAGMLERLMEAYNRKLWDASEEELDEIRRAFLETDCMLEQ